MSSDLLLLFDAPLGGTEAEKAKQALYDASQSALVTFDEARPKVFLVRFDPEQDNPTALLNAVSGAGFAVRMAGG